MAADVVTAVIFKPAVPSSISHHQAGAFFSELLALYLSACVYVSLHMLMYVCAQHASGGQTLTLGIFLGHFSSLSEP